jgi:hypothetical protein
LVAAPRHRVVDAAGGGSDEIAVLLDGGGAGVPEDTGGPAHYGEQLNRLVAAALLPVSGRPRPTVPGSEAFYALLNKEFRKKNCDAVRFDPRHCDLPRARAALAAALRSRRSRPALAARSFAQTLVEGGVRLDVGSDDLAPGKRVVRACAVCGVTAGLLACARCEKVHYCGAAHQKAHWKSTHKPECKKH